MKLAVTGHRPNRLFKDQELCYDRAHYSCLLAFCMRAMEHYQRKTEEELIVLVGMAIGFDMAIAEACKDLGIPYIAYIPFRGQERLWPVHTQTKYQDLLNHAQEIKLVTDTTKYQYFLMHRRNHRMVMDSNQLLALWNGSPTGGTHECYDFACNFWIDTPDYIITNIWDNWIEWKKKYNLL